MCCIKSNVLSYRQKSSLHCKDCRLDPGGWCAEIVKLVTLFSCLPSSVLEGQAMFLLK